MYLELFADTWRIVHEMSEVLRQRFITDDEFDSNRNTYRQIKALAEFSRCAFDVTELSRQDIYNYVSIFADVSFKFSYHARYEHEGTLCFLAYVSMSIAEQLRDALGVDIDPDAEGTLDCVRRLYDEGYVEYRDEDGFVF